MALQTANTDFMIALPGRYLNRPRRLRARGPFSLSQEEAARIADHIPQGLTGKRIQEMLDGVEARKAKMIADLSNAAQGLLADAAVAHPEIAHDQDKLWAKVLAPLASTQDT